MSNERQLLSELLRPQQLSDLTLPQKEIDRLQKMIDSGNIMNMIFYGPPGLGKTSAARVIGDTANVTFVEVNAASILGPKDLRRDMEGFATSMPMFGNSKLCLFDEADYISKQVQASLRHLVESTSDNCRFLFTANDIRRITEALRSRLKHISFDISSVDKSAVIERLVARYETKLGELGIQYEPQRLRELVGIYFPDLRSIANNVEFEFA